MSQEGENGQPTFEELITNTISKFNSQETFLNNYQGTEPYLIIHAAGDVVDPIVNIDEIFNTLTRIQPNGLKEIFDSIDAANLGNWDTFKRETCAWIITLEVFNRYPEHKAENHRRMDTLG